MSTLALWIGWIVMAACGIGGTACLLILALDKAIQMFGIKHEFFCYMWDRKLYRTWKERQKQMAREIEEGDCE